MADEQTTSGLDLHVETGGPRREGLESALRDAVRSGRLTRGSRLPATRVLARDLGLSRTTVVQAYAELVAEGWLTAQHGSGTRVADVPAAATERPEPTAEKPPAARYSLVPGTPDLSGFPRSGWLSALRRGLDEASSTDLGYGDPRGLRRTRVALAGYLGRVRGVRTDPDRIVITAGFAHALPLLVSTVTSSPGARSVVVEAYSLVPHRRAWLDAGFALRPVPVDDDGARLLDPGVLDGATAVQLTPAHQFPLGTVLAASRRTALVGWARDAGALVLEDDYDGEFRYDRRPVGAVQGLGPDVVAYAGTASKTLAPGLRLGWLAVPAGRLDAVVEAVERTGAQPSVLEQLALTSLLESGGYDRHVRAARLRYRRRRDTLVAALRDVPGATVSGIAAGLQLLLTLPDGLDEATVEHRARRRGLAVQGLGGYGTGVQPHPPALVVGYGTPPDHAFTGAVARLVASVAASVGA